jgi:hypothetical protein
MYSTTKKLFGNPSGSIEYWIEDTAYTKHTITYLQASGDLSVDVIEEYLEDYRLRLQELGSTGTKTHLFVDLSEATYFPKSFRKLYHLSNYLHHPSVGWTVVLVGKHISPVVVPMLIVIARLHTRNIVFTESAEYAEEIMTRKLAEYSS